MPASGDYHLVDRHDLVDPKCFECVKGLGNVRGGGRSCDPLLVLLNVQAASFDDADSDVNDAVINDRVPRGIGSDHACEEAEGKGFEAIARMPVGGQLMAVHIAIFHRQCTIVLREPLEHVEEDNIRFAEALLLKGGTDPDQNSVEENISEGSIHGDDVIPCFFVKGMSRTSCSMVIFVGTAGIVRYFIQNRCDWCKGIMILVCSEEPVDGAWTCTEKKVHRIGCWGAMCLGTLTHVEQLFN